MGDAEDDLWAGAEEVCWGTGAGIWAKDCDCPKHAQKEGRQS